MLQANQGKTVNLILENYFFFYLFSVCVLTHMPEFICTTYMKVSIYRRQRNPWNGSCEWELWYSAKAVVILKQKQHPGTDF